MLQSWSGPVFFPFLPMSSHLAYRLFYQAFSVHVLFDHYLVIRPTSVSCLDRSACYIPHPSINNITFIIIIIIEEMHSRDNYLQEYMFRHIAINYLSVRWRLQSIVPTSDSHYCLCGAHDASCSTSCVQCFCLSVQ